jgi:hypothetical protein
MKPLQAKHLRSWLGAAAILIAGALIMAMWIRPPANRGPSGSGSPGTDLPPAVTIDDWERSGDNTCSDLVAVATGKEDARATDGPTLADVKGWIASFPPAADAGKPVTGQLIASTLAACSQMDDAAQSAAPLGKVVEDVWGRLRR